MALTASNFDAVLYDVGLGFDGEWIESADIWKHVSVSVSVADSLGTDPAPRTAPHAS